MRLSFVLLLLCLHDAAADDEGSPIVRTPARIAFDKLQREDMESSKRLKPGSVSDPEWQDYFKD